MGRRRGNLFFQEKEEVPPPSRRKPLFRARRPKGTAGANAFYPAPPFRRALCAPEQENPCGFLGGERERGTSFS